MVGGGGFGEGWGGYDVGLLRVWCDGSGGGEWEGWLRSMARAEAVLYA